jgi:FkbM family methyltransferase
MIEMHGLFWPDDVGTKWKHSFKHVKSLEWAMAHCPRHRTAVQAGGNIGLWPRRLAERFQRVITFEPDAESRACLAANVPASVEVRPEALGAKMSQCGITHLSLGSHHVVHGDAIPMISIDSLGLTDVDFLQLDIEGYEWHALSGAMQTLRACRPLVQVELRDFTARYGKTDDDVRFLLGSVGYREVSQQPGNDVVFQVAA